jgi:glycosyltransferase involved in cell wall biosynthesis
VARGVQNKILEAMAMGRPVIASATCAVGIRAERGEEMLVAESAAEWQTEVSSLLVDEARAVRIGQQARERVLADYSWNAHLQEFRALIEGPHKAGAATAARNDSRSSSDSRPGTQAVMAGTGQ